MDGKGVCSLVQSECNLTGRVHGVTGREADGAKRVRLFGRSDEFKFCRQGLLHQRFLVSCESLSYHNYTTSICNFSTPQKEIALTGDAFLLPTHKG